MPSTDRSTVPFHALAPDAVLAQLGSGERGLNDAEAAARLQRHGPNRLPPPPRRPAFLRFLAQFNNFVIHVLLAAAAVTGVLGQWLDCSVILGVVVINALIGFIQEGRAEHAIAAVRRLLSLEARVRRDGTVRTVAADQLVPGDVIELESGDRVPADARLLATRELRVDEAMLTGESVPVEKRVEPTPGEALLADRVSMAYSGTLVTLGRASAVVVATGAGTEMGHISSMLADVQTLTTPLLRQLSAFGRRLTAVILAVTGAAFLFGTLVRHYPATDMFLAGVGLAVAAIPEGLPAIITITLAVGVQRMARHNAVIRRLPAVETLGSVSIICSDKTGTLTRNEMNVRTVAVAGLAPITVEGDGYAPEGGLRLDGRELHANDRPRIAELCTAAMLCNDAAVQRVASGWEPVGDPTEAALVVMGMKAGLEPGALKREWPRSDVIPFESRHSFMATLHRDPGGEHRILVKGAPEVVLARCRRQRSEHADAPLDGGFWHERVREISSAGQRTIAVAARTPADHRDRLEPDDISDLVMLGVIGISDPPRADAVEALEQCRSAGIEVKMVTGDHAGTALAIAAQMGFPAPVRAASGAELDRLDDAALAGLAPEVSVFSRTSPEHKLRLVTALQAGGQVVAMTGDGVNDAPALKRADVGVAMGIKGTEAAKEAAQMVLADDNFASIVRAVREGRTVFDNIIKSILFILPTSAGEALTILAAIGMGMMLPVTPVQILWVNMVTTVTLALALSFEPAEPGLMRRPPRDPAAPILSALMSWRIVFVSLLMVAGTFGLFLLELSRGVSTEEARTVAVNTLVMCEAFYLVNTRFLYASALSRKGLSGNPYIWISILLVLLLQVIFTYAPFMQLFFETRDLAPGSWMRIAGVGLLLFALVEFEKRLLAGRRDHAPAG